MKQSAVQRARRQPERWMFSAAVYQVDHMCSGEFCANVLAHTVCTGRLYLSALFLHSTPIPSELHSLAHSLTHSTFPSLSLLAFHLLPPSDAMQRRVCLVWQQQKRRHSVPANPTSRRTFRAVPLAVTRINFSFSTIHRSRASSLSFWKKEKFVC